MNTIYGVGITTLAFFLTACSGYGEAWDKDENWYEITFQEYLDQVKNRYTTESLECGTSDVTNGYTEQTNPELTTCLHNAFANLQEAHGYYTSYNSNTEEALWVGYSTHNGEVEYLVYTQEINNPSEERHPNTNICDTPSLPDEPPMSRTQIFDCER